ncbi:MAG TPA: DUF1569 domain-containing protein [Tepidisphaeraceae bacterium]|nr:DUF1569 domain-containing protein [Tepidisphaeraceae bacterium]
MSTTSTPTRRPLAFATEDGVLAEVARLRRHGYQKTGNWSLPQIAWHLMIPIDAYLNPPASPDIQPTPEQAKMKAGFVDYIVANGKLPPHATTAPPSWTPPADAGDADVERLVIGMNKLKNYPHAMVEMSVIGPVPIAECRRVHLVHAAHHLSFLQPKNARRDVLRFKSPDQAIADVRALKKGHKQAGDWTLPQACWHLNVALGNTMRPGPHAESAPMTDELRRRLQGILNTGQLPQGVQAPATAAPPADAPESSIDTFIATLERWESYRGDFAPHRIFGKISDDEMCQLAMIHCAHHLSFFVPTGE